MLRIRHSRCARTTIRRIAIILRIPREELTGACRPVPPPPSAAAAAPNERGRSTPLREGKGRKKNRKNKPRGIKKCDLSPIFATACGDGGPFGPLPTRRKPGNDPPLPRREECRNCGRAPTRVGGNPSLRNPTLRPQSGGRGAAEGGRTGSGRSATGSVQTKR